jgi:hypothetical protein
MIRTPLLVGSWDSQLTWNDQYAKTWRRRKPGMHLNSSDAVSIELFMAIVVGEDSLPSIHRRKVVIYKVKLPSVIKCRTRNSFLKFIREELEAFATESRQ